MSRKRLNKKVAIIGSVVFALLIMFSIALVLYMSRNPKEFIRDGDAALKRAREATDEEVKAQEYERAVRNYNQANSLAKSDDLILSVLFKLSDLYLETGRWRNMLGCMNRIVNIDPDNIKARLTKLEYFYTVADSGAGISMWQEVQSQASDFIEHVEDSEKLTSTQFRLESLEEDETLATGKTLGSYLYLVRGRARLTLARMGATTEPVELLDQAQEDLEKARDFEPDNVTIYWYLAQAAVARGQMQASGGNVEARNKAYQKAVDYLQEAIELSPQNVQAHLNLLRVRFQQLADAVKPGLSIEQFKESEEVVSYRSDLFSLADTFDNHPMVHYELSRFYEGFDRELDKAVEAADKALTADSENVTYALRSCYLHYRKFSQSNDKYELDKALDIANRALGLPGTQETSGPRSLVHRNNRLSFYFLLATCYIEQLLEPVEFYSESERQELLQKAEESVHQIEQIFGSGEDPYVVLWQGMLEFAKGDKNSAIRKLYSSYNQLKVTGIEDPSSRRTLLRDSYSFMSYTLANYYKETPEKGAYLRFLRSSFLADRIVTITGITLNRPEVPLVIAEQLIDSDSTEAIQEGLLYVELHDRYYGAGSRSKQLRIRAYINANQVGDAEKELAAAVGIDVAERTELQLSLLQSRIQEYQKMLNTISIQENFRASGIIQESEIEDTASSKSSEEEINTYRQEYSKLINEHLEEYAEFLNESTLLFACRNFIALNDIESARRLIDIFLTHKPDNLTALFYKEYLNEPEPANISAQKQYEIQEQVISNQSDIVERRINLAGLYIRENEYDKAAENLNKVLRVEAWENEQGFFERPDFEDIEPTHSQLQMAAGQFFSLAIGNSDWELAQKIAHIARVENLDECEGHYFSARLSFAQNNYEDAFSHIEAALNLRPIFSYGYILRSSINGALGNSTASIEDALEAVRLNPQNPDHAKRLALVLYQRNQQLGDSVTREQAAETRNALDQALALNPSDRQLLSFYAEFISSKKAMDMGIADLDRAFAIRQYLYRTDSNMENALLLGAMAMRIADFQTDEELRKEAFRDIAGHYLSEAYKMNPKDSAVLDTYARYYRAIGKEDKAWEILEASDDQGLLWRNYYSQGRYQEAKNVLERLLEDNPEDPNSVLGLLMVSREMGDIEGVKRNSDRLISLSGQVQNNLIQIQTFLEVGLVKEAGLKLQSFMEKFPEETRALLFQAWLMMRQGRLTDALNAVNRYLEINEESPVAWEVRGRIRYLLADYDQAINDFNRSRMLFNSPQSKLSIYLSRAYMGAGRTQEAVIELQNAIDNPQFVDKDKARQLLEQLYKRHNRKEDLRRFYDSTLEELPYSTLWCLKAASFAQQEENYASALILYKRALELSQEAGQNSLPVLDGYLSTLISDGQYSEVLDTASQYVNGEYAPFVLFRMAEAKLKSGDRLKAVEYCQKALHNAEPRILHSSEIMDRIYSLLGKEFLYDYCREQLSVYPNSEKMNLIMFYLMIKDNEQYNLALEYINKCLQFAAPDSPHILIYTLEKAKALNLAYEKTSDKTYLSMAVKEHKSLLQKLPNNSGVLNNLAYLLAESEESLTQALEYGRRAYETQPNNPSFLDTYAFVLYKNGKYKQAVELAQAAIQHFEDTQMTVPAAVYEHLGMIREKLGLTNEAKEAYQQALSNGGLSEKSVNRIKSAMNKMSQKGL